MRATEAYEAMLAHHQKLGEDVAERADAVSAAVATGEPYGAPLASLVAYLADEVLPHAWAEEKTIYRAATAHANMAGVVGEMTADHVTLAAIGTRLAAPAGAAAAADNAQRIADLFVAHAARENDVLLPALLAEESVDLAALMGQMHDRAGAAADPDLDVRDLPPARRHEAIFDVYEALPPGAGFVLVDDRDPRPLWYQFEAEYAGWFTWDSLEAGPGVWRVRIGRTGPGRGRHYARRA